MYDASGYKSCSDLTAFASVLQILARLLLSEALLMMEELVRQPGKVEEHRRRDRDIDVLTTSSHERKASFFVLNPET